MTGHNIVSVSWGDHLMFGEVDGRLNTLAAVRRRMDVWREKLGASIIHWRAQGVYVERHLHVGDCREHPRFFVGSNLDWNALQSVPELAHEAGLEAYLYLSLFDEGWPLPPPVVRAVSYHNAMHGQHVSWQTAFCRDHPEFMVVDRSGRNRQWGVSCLAYPEVRAHFRDRFLSLLDGTGFDGLFVCLRSQSRPADFADQYGFNELVRRDYRKRFGKDLGDPDFDVQAWRDLLGEYLTTFLAELRAVLLERKLGLAVGAARGDVLGPPLGNAPLQWREWVERDLVDELVINQNSSRCPSMWHDLWPMHRGSGYLQNYLDGSGLPPLGEHVKDVYAKVFAGNRAKLYIARQWDHRDEATEAALSALPAVNGLVFSSFRHDNPGPIARGDWQA